MYIIISGMNNITINLAKKFISDGNEITFIGLDKDKAEEIEKDIGFVTVLGSSYNKSTLIEAGIERANFFVASNMEDEINFLSIKLAKHLNNEIISICLVNKISNKKNFSGEDFDFALEYDEMISDTLNSFIANKFDQLIYTNTDNHTEIRVISVGNDSDLIGKTLNDIDLSKESEVIAIISSSGSISHNLSNTLNPLDKIIIQSTIIYKNNE
tara:strand:- start:29304 stop:29942 length:639 start_codon:yes stop_codon:yes gene_type:complete